MPTREEFIDVLIQIHQKKKQINQLSNERRAAENGLVGKYRINECNAERNKIQFDYDNQIKAINREIMNLEDALG